VGAGSDLHVASNLPDDVGCQGAASEGDALVGCHDEVAGHLEDPRVGVASLNADVSGDIDPGGKRVEAGLERQSSQIAAAEVQEVGRGATSCVRVGDLHVADCHGQVRRRGRPVISGVHFAGDLRGCRRYIGGIKHEREAGYRRGGDGAHGDVTCDHRRGHSRDACFGEDGVGAGSAKVDDRRRTCGGDTGDGAQGNDQNELGHDGEPFAWAPVSAA
jgi:hypothetical protein